MGGGCVKLAEVREGGWFSGGKVCVKLVQEKGKSHLG